MDKHFKIENTSGTKDEMSYDSITIFFDEKNGKVEAEYYYFKGLCNYLLSWGFTKGSLGEFRKSKANKTKKPYFSLQKGWFNEDLI